MSKLVREENAAVFEDIYVGGYDKRYPSLDLVRLESWYFGGRPGCVLDYGCGPGTNGIHLLDRGYDVVFTDVSREALRRVEEKLAIRPDAVRRRAVVRPVDIAADSLPDSDASFDYVVCLSVLGNLETAERICHVLREFRRVLRPGGKTIIDINAPQSSYVDKAVTLVATATYDTRPRRGFESDPVRMYFPDSAEAFVEMVRGAGLIVDDIGHSSFEYQGHRENEHIVCARKSD